MSKISAGLIMITANNAETHTYDKNDIKNDLDTLSDCTCCPRSCHANRCAGRLGWCQSSAEISVGSICVHRGEEPAISGSRGICNVFFSRCNMQCVFCQNRQISRTKNTEISNVLKLSGAIAGIEKILDGGVHAVGFVSPSHYIAQMKVIIKTLRSRGRRPVFIMNTNAYDLPETLASLSGLIDIYLPDLKYMDDDLALRLSQAPEYSKIAKKAIKEMFRQKGKELFVDERGLARRGLIIRHLILPGQIKNSLDCLRFIAQELSPLVYISVMSQYMPVPAVKGHQELGRCITAKEYTAVLHEVEKLGFVNGWQQDLASPSYYLPDFTREDPFENKRTARSV